MANKRPVGTCANCLWGPLRPIRHRWHAGCCIETDMDTDPIINIRSITYNWNAGTRTSFRSDKYLCFFSCTLQCISSRLWILVKYVLTPPATGVWTEASICQTHKHVDWEPLGASTFIVLSHLNVRGIQGHILSHGNEAQLVSRLSGQHIVNFT